ncbi:hypothetical protein BDW22DRAFT_1326392 [Trametopsis cervina]|nr:hypothetical protein BDW22DRAFT_1326392 [Trametopsis cervina]
MQAKRVRIAALFYPAPGVSREEFSRYWLEEHGKIFMSLDIVKKNLTKYEQFHFNLDMNNKLSEAMGTVPSPFWGLVMFEAESYDKIMEVLSHPEYIRLVYPDEGHIMDRSKSQVISGEFATLFEKARL